MRLLLPVVVVLCPVLAGAGLLILRRRVGRRQQRLVELRPMDGAKLDLEAWKVFFQSLYAITPPLWKRWLLGVPSVAFDLSCEGGRVRARCWLPDELVLLVTPLLRTACPGIAITAGNPPTLGSHAARARLKLWNDPLFPLAQPRTDGLRSVVDALSAGGVGTVQIVLRPEVDWQRRALRELDVRAGFEPQASLPMRLLSGLVGFVFNVIWSGDAKVPPDPTPTHRDPLPPDTKARQPGYRVEIRLRMADATRARAKFRMHALTGAFRAFDGLLNGLRPARVWLGERFDSALLGGAAPGANGPVLVPEELAAIFHLPVVGGDMEVAPVRLAPARPPAGRDKVLCVADDDRGSLVAITQADARHHAHFVGPTGVGKSTLILNLALQDVEAGRGLLVVDPARGDLVRDLLARIPRSEWDRVHLIDPTQRQRPVGLNVLEGADGDHHEVITDHLVTIFHRAFERYWGPRTDDVLRAALLTLLHRPGATVCEVPLLLLHPEVRAELIGRLDDPVGLEPFWDEYERLSEAQRLQVVGPVLNKLRAVLLRRTVRNILGQTRSTIRLAEIMDRGGILLVSLPKGLVGEDTSRLMGSFVMARIWQAAMARADRPESERPDFACYLDEFHNFFHLPQTTDEVLVEARGYRLPLVLANQHLGQLPSSIKEALASNARTRIVFQVGQEDARYLAREYEPYLTERDLRHLQLHQVAVRLCVNGRTDRPFTGSTLPPPPSFGQQHADQLVRAAIERDGRPRAAVEAEINRRLGYVPPAEEDLAA